MRTPLFIILLLLVAGPTPAATIVDNERGFTLTLPKGFVLSLAVLIYVAGTFLAKVRVSETMIVGGSLKMLGFAGILLGIIDLIRQRKPAPSPEDEPPRLPGNNES